jgi:hypothetical protein
VAQEDPEGGGALMASENDTLQALIRLHDSQLDGLRKMDAYYEGEQPLSYMHPELVQQLEGQVRQVVINWPQMVVDAVEERLDIEGFRRPDHASGDDELWDIWQDNDLDAGSQRAHVEALSLGRSYVVVGAPDADGDAPVITDESALDMIASVDPRTREVSAAVRRWSDKDDQGPPQVANMATLYLPNATIHYRRDGTDWSETGRDPHELGVVPVVPILNRSRRRKPYGVSELKLVTPLSDAACKIATDMMVGANFHALPRYYAAGVTEQDFTDDQGNPISVWKAVTGRIFATENEQAKLGTFPASDLSNFHKTLDALAQLVASLCGMPPHYLGFTTDNPASADAIRSSEARLVKRCERKQGMFDCGWEQVMRLAVRVLHGQWDEELTRLETAWRDPSTPTVAQVADAATKAYQAGIVPLRFTRRRLGFSDAEIAQMEEMDAQDAASLKVPTAAELMELRAPRLTSAAASDATGSSGSPAQPAAAGGTA